MSDEVRRNEWKDLKDQFDELIRSGRAKDDDVEKLFDAQIRRRFGEMISQALLNPKERRH
jgi:hypothetical protein